MSDGTPLNLGSGGDLISDEDMTNQPRQSPLVPQLGATNAGYKIERTKLVVGPYGYDYGDPTQDQPLPVESRADRQRLELMQLSAIEARYASLQTRSQERTGSVFGSRGYTDRGVR